MAESKAKAPAKKADEDSSDEAKTVTLKSPWGTKVTIPAESVDTYLDANYKK